MGFYKQKQINFTYLLLPWLMRIANIFCSMLEQYLSQLRILKFNYMNLWEKTETTDGYWMLSSNKDDLSDNELPYVKKIIDSNGILVLSWIKYFIDSTRSVLEQEYAIIVCLVYWKFRMTILK